MLTGLAYLHGRTDAQDFPSYASHSGNAKALLGPAPQPGARFAVGEDFR